MKCPESAIATLRRINQVIYFCLWCRYESVIRVFCKPQKQVSAKEPGSCYKQHIIIFKHVNVLFFCAGGVEGETYSLQMSFLSNLKITYFFEKKFCINKQNLVTIVSIFSDIMTPLIKTWNSRIYSFKNISLLKFQSLLAVKWTKSLGSFIAFPATIIKG